MSRLLSLSLLGLAIAAPRANADLTITLEGLPAAPVTAGQDIDFRIRMSGASADFVQSYQLTLKVASSDGTSPGAGTFSFDVGDTSNPLTTSPSPGYVFGDNSPFYFAYTDASQPGAQLLSISDTNTAGAVNPQAGVNDLVFAGKLKIGSYNGSLEFSFLSGNDDLFLLKDYVNSIVVDGYDNTQTNLAAQRYMIPVASVPEPSTVALVLLGVPGLVGAWRVRRRAESAAQG